MSVQRVTQKEQTNVPDTDKNDKVDKDEDKANKANDDENETNVARLKMKKQAL